jgi:hypothetical protein
MNMTFLIITIGWTIIGFLAGSVIAAALKKSVTPIGSLQAFLVALSWALGWAIGNIVWNYAQIMGLISREFPYNYVMVGIIAGLIGGGCTVFMIYRSHASG